MVPVGKQQVITAFDMLKDSKHINWKIYSGYNARQGAVMASSEFANPDKNIDYELSRAHLKKCLELLIPGNYMIQFKDAPNSTNNIITNYFEVEAIQGVNQQQNFPAMGAFMGQAPAGFISTEHHRLAVQAEADKVRAEYEKKEWERRFNDIEKQLKTAKKETGSETLKEFTSAIKMGLSLLQSNQPARAQVSVTGLNSPEVPSNQQEEKHEDPELSQEEKIAREAYSKKLLGVYHSVIQEMWNREGGDEEGIKLLFCLNAYCKANPELYENIVKPQLKPFEDSFYDLLES